MIPNASDGEKGDDGIQICTVTAGMKHLMWVHSLHTIVGRANSSKGRVLLTTSPRNPDARLAAGTYHTRICESETSP